MLQDKRSKLARWCSLYGFIIIFILCSALPGQAQVLGNWKEVSNPPVDTTLFQTLSYRSLGPFRGGRSPAVSGVIQDSRTYYMGTAGGGVYKTSDGGNNWKNVSDRYFKTSSVGAVTVAPTDSNIVYVGMGETNIRGNVQPGAGVYKSTDAGKTWQFMGLGETQFIGDIKVHPDNPDIVWLAALGQVFGTEGNEERGVYKSTNGGKTWKQVLFVDNHTGAVNLAIDQANPQILYASMWQVHRTPWELVSGGKGSGLYKSTDGGETWEDISGRSGLPGGISGKIGVDISPANPARVYAIIENKNGGLFRSDDSGETWELVSDKPGIRLRSWYYTKVFADPQDEDVVYVPNVRFHKSTDGGKTFKTISTPHGDNHDLWINPDNPQAMIISNDGGGQVSFNGGKSWSSYYKYPTGEFYHVITDDQFPYRLYGAQQDNSTLVMKNRTDGVGITIRDWQPVAGGESGYIAPNPENPDETFGGSYGGLLERFNTITQQSQRVDVWPDNPMGHGAKDVKHRFQWTYPVYFSPHPPHDLYATSQYINRSTDGGNSWEQISPDLTRDDKSKQQKSGGPITKDDTSVEYYNTVFSFSESPIKKGVLWAGSDDGLVHVSRDNGEKWEEVTPPNMPEAKVSSIDPSSFDAGTAYIAATRYLVNDYTPMLYKTDDYGKSWTKITNGIPKMNYTRVVREDPNREGLLFAGTATGVYVSFNDGKQWQPFNRNLPAVEVRDLQIQKRAKDLVLATNGRAFWIFDDLGMLEQIDENVKKADNYLFKPEETYLFGGPGYSLGEGPSDVGENPESGVVVHYKLTNPGNKEVKLQFLENNGTVIRTFSNKEDQSGNKVKQDDASSPKQDNDDEEYNKSEVLDAQHGLNKFAWNMIYEGATKFDSTQVLWAGSTRGARAIPGTYQVRLIIDGNTVKEQPFIIKKDPRINVTQEDFEAQFKLQQKIIAKLDTTNKALNEILRLFEKIEDMKSNDELDGRDKELVNTIEEKLKEIQGELMQPKSVGMQDPLNYPIKLDNKLASLSSVVGTGDNRPTTQMYEVYEILARQVDEQLEKLNDLMEGELPGELGEELVPVGSL